jgi:lipoprotein-releasing system permease protein
LINVERASDLANAWGSISKDKVQSWDQANEGTMSVFKTQDIVRNSMTISILVVAAFGIYNILSIAVNQRKKEIAILRSMGFEPGDITNLFFIQGVILGTIGGLIGILLGFLISKYMSTIEVSSQRFLGGGKMMVSFNYLIYIKAFFLAFFSATIASILPARAAGKLEPIDIIRTEGS